MKKSKFEVVLTPESEFDKAIIVCKTVWGDISHAYIRKDGRYIPKDYYDNTPYQTNYPISQVPKYILKKAGYKETS